MEIIYELIDDRKLTAWYDLFSFDQHVLFNVMFAMRVLECCILGLGENDRRGKRVAV